MFWKKSGQVFLLIIFILAAFSPVKPYAQESIRSSYERSFIRASLAAKTGILYDAATDERAWEFIGDLYAFALQFALTNSILYDDPDMITLVGVAARGAAANGSRASVDTLLDLMDLYRDSYSKVEILNALGILGTGNQRVVESLNRFLDSENDLYRRDMTLSANYSFYGPESSGSFTVIRACVSSLGMLGDPSSFPYLFSAMTAGYPPALTTEIQKALESIRGNLKDYLIEIIRQNPFPEKIIAFRIGAFNENLVFAERGELAQIALEVSLNTFAPPDNSLRYEAITALTRLKWTPAAPLAIRNFYLVQTDYNAGTVPRERLLEAIECLGFMSSSEAAKALALQLGYLNSADGARETRDEAIVLAIINALGELGDKAAFDSLLYINYLNYPEEIQAAAREALNRLKW